jgi:hypothetical protein
MKKTRQDALYPGCRAHQGGAKAISWPPSPKINGTGAGKGQSPFAGLCNAGEIRCFVICVLVM